MSALIKIKIEISDLNTLKSIHRVHSIYIKECNEIDTKIETKLEYFVLWDSFHFIHSFTFPAGQETELRALPAKQRLCLRR